FFLNTITYDLFGPKTAGAWGTAKSLVGPAGVNGADGADGVDGINGTNGTDGVDGVDGADGADGLDGKTILNGTVDPTSTDGVDGDFFLNTITYDLFGPKTAGAWGSATSMIGPDGQDGKTIISGTSDPTSGDGVDGDYFINTSTLDFFGPKTSGAWGVGNSIQGNGINIHDSDNDTWVSTDLSGSDDDIIRFQTGGNEVIRINDETLEFTNSTSSVLIGESAGLSNAGSENIAVGAYALESITSGSSNVVMGYQAGQKLTTQTGNVLIGHRAGKNLTQSNRLYIHNGPGGNPLIYGEFDNSFVKIGGDLQATSVTETSDRRFKKDITPLNNALSSVLQLEGKRYQWDLNNVANRPFKAGDQIGFIAQEVQKIFPELVKTDSEGYLSMNYSQLTPVLVEAIKEQQTQIDTLNKEVEDLKQKVELLLKAMEKKEDKND
ncbi:MAG: tail fiber domain-containing protein, partial [Cytophagia bacterium]|nr:tail fiber domain-containing protein [Cytophagia bacterium]